MTKTVEPFACLNLAREVVDAIAQCGYEQPTEIQRLAVPMILDGKDVFGAAQTGTGKTAAFAWPLLTLLRNDTQERGPRALVLEPTRELALQTFDALCRYRGRLWLEIGVAIGGKSHREQERRLRRGCDLLIATPGRLHELVLEGTVQLDAVKHVVLDEADTMLDLGFYAQTRRLLRACKPGHQTLFFSATLIPDVEQWAGEILHAPVRVEAAPAASLVATVSEKVVRIFPRQKPAAVLGIVQSLPADTKILVFVRTREAVGKLAAILEGANVPVLTLHGRKKQGQRTKAIESFVSGSASTLICTDVAARGLDLPEVAVVINMDMPQDPLDYVHRVGRTARMGRKGEAISLVADHEVPIVAAIEKITGRRIERVDSQMDVGHESKRTVRTSMGSKRRTPPAHKKPRKRYGQAKKSSRAR